MQKTTASSPKNFPGYVWFESPLWPDYFHVHPHCVQGIDAFRQSLDQLKECSSKEDEAGQRLIQELFQSAEVITDAMVWHTKKNIALILGTAHLFQEAADIMIPASRETELMQNCLRTKASAMHKLLQGMHNLEEEFLSATE